MKKIIYVMISLFCLGTCKIVSGQSTEEKASLSTQIDSISYAMGADLAAQFSELGITINPKGLLKGFNDLSSKSEKELSASMAIIRTFSHEIQTRRGKPFTDSDPPTVNINSLSYAIGLDYGKRLKDGGLEMNAQEVFDGCLAALNKSSALGGDQIEIQMKTLSTLMQEKKAAKTKIIIEKNKREGAAFLAVNGKKKGVITTASGLQYKVIRPGSGVSPKAESTVNVHYEGKLLDGTIFDSSIQRGKPIEFPLGGVIKGWTEGVQLMKNGSKFQFYIPAELAYGERGSPPNIGPSTTLIFDVELLSFK